MIIMKAETLKVIIKKEFEELSNKGKDQYGTIQKEFTIH